LIADLYRFRGGSEIKTSWRRDHAPVNDSGDADVERAPICPHCGVTALAAETSNVIDTRFVCENPDCEAFGEEV
jgi:hypothetical protein